LLGSDSLLRDDLQSYLSIYPEDVEGVNFCQGLSAYLSGDYASVIRFWHSPLLTPQICSKHPKWMQSAWRSVFSPLWFETKLALCECELNQFDHVRHRLEPLTAVDSKQYAAEIHFLLALNSLKEFSTLTGRTQKNQCLEMMRFHLKEASSFKASLQQSTQLTNYLVKAIEYELEKPSEDNLSYLITTLEERKGVDALKALVSSLTRNIDIIHKNEPFFLWLRERFSKSIFTKLIEDELGSHLVDHLHYDTLNDFRDLYDVLYRFHSNPEAIKIKASQNLKGLAFEWIFKDDLTLSHTLAYLAQWMNLNPAPEQRTALCHEIERISERLWLRQGEESKATTLMEVAIYISEENLRGPLHQKIETFLTSLYHKAERSNTLKRLSWIYDAFDRLQVFPDDLINNVNLENHLADADYLFKIHRFEEAQAHAEWVLKCDPMNQSALRLYGLTCYYQGEYFRAFHALTCLVDPDEHAQNVLQLSQRMQFQEEGSLITIDP
jgi:hypothetical protein